MTGTPLWIAWPARLASVVTTAGLLAIPTGAAAQTTGAVRGLVVDADGQAVAAARVVVTGRRDPDARLETETSADGRFAYDSLATGFYTVTADKAELGGEAFRIRVRSGRTVEVSFTLSPDRRAAAWLVDQGGREALSNAFAAGVDANRERDFEMAVARFTQALALNSACVECHFNLGIAYGDLARFDEAEAAFRAALDIEPDYAAAYYGLAALYARQNRTADAARARGEANRIALERLAISRAEAADAVSRGITFLGADNVGDAQRWFEAAIELDPTYSPAYYWLGMTLLRRDRPDAAASHLERYLKLEASGEHAEDARDRLRTLRRPDPS